MLNYEAAKEKLLASGFMAKNIDNIQKYEDYIDPDTHTDLENIFKGITGVQEEYKAGILSSFLERKNEDIIKEMEKFGVSALKGITDSQLEKIKVDVQLLRIDEKEKTKLIGYIDETLKPDTTKTKSKVSSYTTLNQYNNKLSKISSDLQDKAKEWKKLEELWNKSFNVVQAKLSLDIDGLKKKTIEKIKKAHNDLELENKNENEKIVKEMKEKGITKYEEYEKLKEDELKKTKDQINENLKKVDEKKKIFEENVKKANELSELRKKEFEDAQKKYEEEKIRAEKDKEILDNYEKEMMKKTNKDFGSSDPNETLDLETFRKKHDESKKKAEELRKAVEEKKRIAEEEKEKAKNLEKEALKDLKKEESMVNYLKNMETIQTGKLTKIGTYSGLSEQIKKYKGDFFTRNKTALLIGLAIGIVVIVVLVIVWIGFVSTAAMLNIFYQRYLIKYAKKRGIKIEFSYSSFILRTILGPVYVIYWLFVHGFRLTPDEKVLEKDFQVNYVIKKKNPQTIAELNK